jgi:neutral ceramidase
MDRTVRFCLSVMVIALVGAFSVYADEPIGGFRAGAAVSDITPPVGVGIDGVIARDGPNKGAHDPLHARSLAFDDGTTKLILTICDVRMIGRRVCDEAKKRVSEKTGVPVSNLLIAATHTHGTPTPIDLFETDQYKAWQESVIDGIAMSMEQAVANLAPAQIGWASVHKPDYTFNRRWKVQPGAMLKNPWGETTDGVLTNPGVSKEKLIEQAGPVDDELTVISVRHADGRPLSVMANYSTHYVGSYADQLVSADYYGVFSEQVKQLLAPSDDSKFVAMMFNGTSGDVNTINFAGDRSKGPPWIRIEAIGKDMAATAVGLMKDIKYTHDIKLAAAVQELELGIRKPDAKRLEWANAIQANPPKPGGLPVTYAREAIALSKRPDTVKLIVQAFRVGELGITGLPAEVFAETGLEIKKHTPIPRTINIGLANGYGGYLPTPEQHKLRGYETWESRVSFLEVDASTKIRDTALNLLAKVR